MITVRAIGAAEVQIGRKRITKSTELVLAVAVYLCVRAGDRLTRDEMIDVFWPGHDVAKGRHSLRQMLYKLRLKGFTLDEDGELLLVDRARVECDATRALEETWPETAEPWMIEDSGEFLPGVTRDISPQFQEWLDATRSRLGAQYRRAALRQIVQARREGRWADLERWGRVVLRTDPLNEEATLARAESSAMAGSKATALEILDQYVEDLGERAGQIALPATVLRRRISERKPEWGGRGVAEVALVGREKPMQRLTTALERAAEGRGSAILLFGAPGIGKTRLSNEIRDFARLSGFRCCSVRATQADSGRPFSLAIAVAAEIRNLPGVAGTSPAALALLSRLCDTTPNTSGHATIGHTISAEETGWALAEAVSAAADEGRLLVSIDDLHNADDQSVDVVTLLAQMASSTRFLLIATSRLTSDRAPRSPEATLPAFVSIPVPPLAASDAELLVALFATPSHGPLTTQASTAITRAGGGNPLFLRELTSQRTSHAARLTVPQSLVAVIEQRTERLSSNELRLLRFIAVLGPLARLSRLRVLLPPTQWHYDSFLEQLELEGVLSLSDTGSLELHECWHDAISGSLKGAARSALSLDAASLFASEPATDGSLSNYWRAAELFAAAGSHDRSIEQFRLVATLFMRRGLPQQAVEALTQALAMGSDSRERMELLSLLADAQNLASLYEDACTSCHSALAYATDPSSETATTRVLTLTTLVDSQMKLGKPIHECIGALALAVSNSGIDDAVCQQSCHVALRSLFNAGAGGSARVFLDASLRSAARSGVSLMGSVVRLIYTAELGDATELAHVEQEVADRCEDADTASLRLLALRYRAQALRFLGRTEDAATVMEQAVHTALAFGSVRDAHVAATSLIFMHLDSGNCDQARRWLEEAERISMPTRGLDLEHSIVHARARYLAGIGDAAGSLAAYAPHMEAVRADTVPRRSAVDRACLALAHSMLGDTTSAREHCTHTITLLNKLRPGISEDWVANALIRCLRGIGARDEATSLSDSYLRRRELEFDRPIPADFTELTQARQTLRCRAAESSSS